MAKTRKPAGKKPVKTKRNPRERRLQPGETGRELTPFERRRVALENAIRPAGLRARARLDGVLAEGRRLRGAGDLGEAGLVRP